MFVRVCISVSYRVCLRACAYACVHTYSIPTRPKLPLASHSKIPTYTSIHIISNINTSSVSYHKTLISIKCTSIYILNVIKIFLWKRKHLSYSSAGYEDMILYPVWAVLSVPTLILWYTDYISVTFLYLLHEWMFPLCGFHWLLDRTLIAWIILQYAFLCKHFVAFLILLITWTIFPVCVYTWKLCHKGRIEMVSPQWVPSYITWMIFHPVWVTLITWIILITWMISLLCEVMRRS